MYYNVELLFTNLLSKLRITMQSPETYSLGTERCNKHVLCFIAFKILSVIKTDCHMSDSQFLFKQGNC